MRQVISLNIGQAGVNIGQQLWERFCSQHDITVDGEKKNKNLQATEKEDLSVFWQQNSKGKFTPRSLFYDSDPASINHIKKGKLKLLDEKYLISNNTNSSHNYARGYFQTNQKLEELETKIAKMLGSCQSLEGFLVLRSLGGGTGSGFGSKLIEELYSMCPKRVHIGIAVFPSDYYSNSFIEPYNTLFSVSNSIDNLGAQLIFDNQRLHNICQNSIGIENPKLLDLNSIIVESTSLATQMMRFSSHTPRQLHHFQTEFVPFSNNHFLISSYSPYSSISNKYLKSGQILDELYSPQNMHVSCNPLEGKYLTTTVFYRGSFLLKDIGFAINQIKSRKVVNFVDWAATGFKYCLSSRQPPTRTKGQKLKEGEGFMIANNTNIKSYFSSFLHKFKLMYKKRAFVHWFLNQGMQDEQFHQTIQKVQQLIADYHEMEDEPNLED